MRSLLAILPIAGLAMASLTPTVPADIPGGLAGPDVSEIQKRADAFAWQEFVALNWPARDGERGEPDRAKVFGDTGLQVWETWKTPEEVFLRDGAEPPLWNSPLPKERALSADLQAVQSDGTLPAILTDQRGHVVRYEVRLNQIAFEYLRSRRLYDSRQQASTESIHFPDGAVVVKASWRELEKGEESRFLARECAVYDLKNGKPGRKRRRMMGLVGLHIVQKTPSAPQWTWATFEQVDNVAGLHPSFAKPGDPTAVNQQTKRGKPNQIVRVPALTPELVALNQEQQNRLRETGSVLQYYQLVGSQWPTPDGLALPAYVANTTMESFVPESSCMGCHAMARTARNDKFVASDFSFLLQRALPEPPKDPLVLPPPTQPKTEWDRKNWAQIQRGYAISEKTYELLPQFVGNKLRCGSCHLDTGRNPSSSWWVGMIAKYEYPGTTKFYERINQCMQRSMNGKPVPTDGPEMNAFIAYFRWLDEQAVGLPIQPTGMPKVATLPGNSERGKALFAQRCGFCHGPDGQGRYESNTYFRPALWGPQSFNNLAGLGAKPEKMAGFLKHNMPFGSGGSLTLQEAWDLTSYIVAQPRPMKKAPQE